jgi:hypothetical protein
VRALATLLLSLTMTCGAACSAADAGEPASRRGAGMPFSLAPGGEAFAGRVDEVLPAGGYTYLRVGDAWVVSLKKPFAVGQRVQVKPIGVAAQFESKRLGRTFGVLYFSVVNQGE